MAKGVNKVILVGNLGRDPEVKYLPSGSAVANIGLATSESWKDKESGEKQERTEWHNLVFFGRVAEIAGEYLKKGSQVYIEGSLRTRKWQDKEGQDRYTTEVVVRDLLLLGGRPQEKADPEPEPEPAPQRGTRGRKPAAKPEPAPAGEDFDDDIPF